MHNVLSMPTTYPVACHTDHVGDGSTFVAIKGHKQDGVAHIVTALHKGARRIIVQADAIIPTSTLQAVQQARANLIIVDDARAALADYAAEAAGYPAQKLTIFAITGTKGKTTSTFLLAHVLKSAGFKVAMLSTVKNTILDVDLPASLTTAQPDYLQQFLALCVEQGVTHVVMEVAAQAATLHRIRGVFFDAIIFTNFSAEHAEFYPTMEEYFAAKCAIVQQAKPDAPVLINADDAWIARMSTPHSLMRFGMHADGLDVQGAIDANSFDALVCRIARYGVEHVYRCPALLGTFNGYNLLGVVSLGLTIGLKPEMIAHALVSFSPVPGRFENRLLPNGTLSIIDYAHNPSSYEAVLSLLRSMTDHLIVVFGCGGERDHGKRPVMGKIAATYADIVVLTADNPRSEDPLAIIDAIQIGIDPVMPCAVVRIIDRAEAIRHAYTLSRKGSIIALLGKGPERYQQIGAEKFYFNEAEIVASLQ